MSRTTRRRRVLCAVAAATMAALTQIQPAAAANGARDQWYLGQFNMSTLWGTTKGAGVLVAVVGTGVDANESDIAPNLRLETDVSQGYAVSGKGDSSTSYDGTQVATLIAGTGTGSSGIEGLAPSASVLPIKALVPGQTTLGGYPLAVGIRYAVDHGARVVVLPMPLTGPSQQVQQAVQYAVTNNVVVIASAGNNAAAGNVLTSPCTAKGVLCVSATTRTGTVWTASSTGSAISLAAPGDQLPVPTAQGSYKNGSSTHFSAALAGGEAALVLAAHPSWTAGQAIRAMIGNTTGGNGAHTRVNDQVGYGIMNPAAAVAAAAPSETTNPFLPLAAPSASAKGGSSPNPSHTAVAAPGKSSGSSILWPAVGGAIAAAVLGVALIWMLIRRRTRSGNYLNDPGYGAGQVFEPDHGWYNRDYPPIEHHPTPEGPEQQFDAEAEPYDPLSGSGAWYHGEEYKLPPQGAGAAEPGYPEQAQFDPGYPEQNAAGPEHPATPEYPPHEVGAPQEEGESGAQPPRSH